MDLPQTMSGVRLTAHGGPEALVWSDSIPIPRPRAGEVLVRVLAAGVNNTDINTRLGWYSSAVSGATSDAEVGQQGGWSGALDFPRIQGGDLCGRVVALGSGVEGFALGARVTCPINQPEPTVDNPRGFVALGSEYDGAFAEYCVVPARHLRDVSASPLSAVEIAAMPCAYGTALNLLTRAGVGPGDKVLVTGASGGVGLAAVQMAAQIGARVSAMTSGAKAEVVRAMGATAVLERDAALPAASYDAVIDVVGGPHWGDLVKALCPGGRLAVSGAIAGPMVGFDLRALYLADITILGCTYQPPEVFDALVAMINAGTLRPLVSKTYLLRDIAMAQADFMAKRYPGKLVLIPTESSE